MAVQNNSLIFKGSWFKAIESNLFDLSLENPQPNRIIEIAHYSGTVRHVAAGYFDVKNLSYIHFYTQPVVNNVPICSDYVNQGSAVFGNIASIRIYRAGEQEKRMRNATTDFLLSDLQKIVASYL